MKGSMQVGGGFPLAFRIAEQLEYRDSLDSIITTYPHFIFRRNRPEQIPRSKFKCVPTDFIEEPIQRTFLKKLISPKWVLKETFDRLASRRIGSPDVLVGWPSSSLRGIRRANDRGIYTVVATDNVNVTPLIRTDQAFQSLKIPADLDNYVFQKRDIDKEIERFDLPGGSVDERYVEKSLREYVAADHLIVPTQYVYDGLVAIGFEESNVSKVPFGVDTEMFRPREKTSESDTFNLLFVGGIRYRKGIQYLIQAINELEDLDLNLTVIGGKQTDLATFGEIPDAIDYLGHVDHKKLPEHYANADAFVFPSILEGFGSVVLEAMASGLPVITTTHTGGVEVIEHGENGFLMPPRDVERIKEHIRFLYHNPDEVTAMGRAARETVETRTWDDYGDAIHSTFEKISNR